MPHRIRHLALFLAAVAFAATSCGKTAPTQVLTAGSSPSAQSQANFDTMDQLFAQSSVTSFDSLGSRLGNSASPIAAVPSPAMLQTLATSNSWLAGQQAVEGIAMRLVAMAAAAGPNPSIAVIAPDLLGKTFVYDPAQLKYVVDPARAGAPANGIRYILYAEDPLTHQPIVTEETGMADLTDEGTALPFGFELRLRVHDHDVDVLDYTLRVDGAPNAGNVKVDGFVANALDRSNFHVGITGVRAFGLAQVHVDFWFDLLGRDFRLAATIDAAKIPAVDVRDIDEAVRLGGHSIRLLGQAHADSVRAVVQMDGAPFAIVSGLASDPTVVDPNGQPLDADDRMMLRRAVRALHRVNHLVHGLLKPAQLLWALSHPPAA